MTSTVFLVSEVHPIPQTDDWWSNRRAKKIRILIELTVDKHDCVSIRVNSEIMSSLPNAYANSVTTFCYRVAKERYILCPVRFVPNATNWLKWYTWHITHRIHHMGHWTTINLRYGLLMIRDNHETILQMFHLWFITKIALSLRSSPAPLSAKYLLVERQHRQFEEIGYEKLSLRRPASRIYSYLSYFYAFLTTKQGIDDLLFHSRQYARLPLVFMSDLSTRRKKSKVTKSDS